MLGRDCRKLVLWSTFQKLSWYSERVKPETTIFTFPRQFLSNQEHSESLNMLLWTVKKTINHYLNATVAPIYWTGYGDILRNVFTLLSCVKQNRAVGGILLNTVDPSFSFSSKCDAPSFSVSDSPIEVEVSHVFGRFLWSAHLLIVEDDPPATKEWSRLKKTKQKNPNSDRGRHENQLPALHLLKSNRIIYHIQYFQKPT